MQYLYLSKCKVRMCGVNEYFYCKIIVNIRHVSIFLCINYIFGRILSNYYCFFFVMFMYNLLVDVLFLFCVLFSQEKLQSSWFCIYACFELNRIHVSWNEHVLIWQYLQGMCTLQAHDKLIKLLSFNKS